MKIIGGHSVTVRFQVTNIGARAGTDLPQLYLVGGSRHARQRLLGWEPVALLPGASREVNITVDPRLLADWDEPAHAWKIRGGSYRLAVARTANDLILKGRVSVDAQSIGY